MKVLRTVLIVVGALVVVYVVAEIVLRAKVRTELDRCRAAGIKTTIEEVTPQPTPQSESAAALVRRCRAAVAAVDRYEPVLADSLGYAAGRSLNEKVAAASAAALPRLCSLALYPAATFGFEYDKGALARVDSFATRLPWLRSILRANARVLTAQGEPDSALALLGVALHTHSYIADPVLIYALVEALGLDLDARDVLAAAPKASPAAIARTRQRLQELDPVSRITASAEAEFVMTDAAIARGGWGLPGPPLPLVNPLAFGPVRQLLRLAFLRRARGQLEKMRGLVTEWPEEPKPAGFAQRYAPDLRLFRRRAALLASCRDVTDIALAMAADRTRTGRMPATLAEFLPQAPNDPFSGKPYLYRAGPDGFVVYGVGLNGKDDGGDLRADVCARVTF